MADEQQQIEGLPEGATLRPVQPAQTAASDSSQVEGLPEGATLRPIAPPAAPTVTKTPTAPHVHAAPTAPVVKGAVAPPSPKQDIVTQIDTTGGLPLDQTLALKAVRGARGLYHGAMGENESETAKGKTSTASPAAENLGFTPENIGYNIGSVGHGIYEFGKEAVKDIFGNTPIVVPNEKGTSIGDPTAHTLMAKYITAPSLAEREESEKEMEKYFKSQGPEAAGHAISAFLHGTLGEYVPAIGPLAMSIEKQAQEGDIGGALAGVASLYAFEKGTGSLKSGIKDRVNARIEELTKTPEVKQAEENVQALAKVREAAEEKHKAAMAEHNKYQASHAQGIGSPEKIVNEVNKAKDALDEAEAHHELAKEDLAKKKAAQPTIPQRVGEAAGRAAGKVLPTPAPTPEVPAENVEAKPVLSRLGQVKPEPTSPDTEWVEGKEGNWQNVLKEPPSLSKLGTKAPINVKTPGQVQPETFPQEPKPTPRVGYGKMNLAGDQGTVGKPLMLTEGTPEGPKVPAGGLPKIKLPETEAPKPQTGTAADLKALKVKEGKVIDTDESPEGRIGRLLQEALKTDTGTNKNFPAAKVEETPTEKRSAERRKEEKPVEEERRQSERRNAAGLRVDEHGDPVLPPNVEAAWQSSAFGEKPVEDVGAKARQANPEPTRAETKAAALPKEEQNSYAAKKEEVVPTGEDVKRPVKSAEEYHPAVEQKINELSDDNLKKLAQAHGLNPDEYDFKARDEHRHRIERDQLAKDITEQIGEDEKINLGRAAESADKEPGFANRDQSAKGRADRAAKLFPRLRGPVDEYGNPKVSGGAPDTVGTKEAADKDTEHFANAKKELGANASISDVAKRAQEMKDAAAKTEDAPDPKAVLDHLKSGKDYALLTAENPNNERATPEQNAQKNREMKAELEKMGYKPTPIEGHVKDVEGQKENSFFVPDISPEDAAKVSRKFGQASVMTKQGIHDLVKNTVHPSGEVLEGPEAAKQDYHSTVAGKPFSVSVDFGKEEEPLTKPTFKTTNRHAEDLSYEHKPEGIENSNQQHRVTTKDENGKKVGEVSAQDTADGEVTVRSDQVYDKNLRGSGRGYDQMKHLLDSVDENTHTVRSDISNSNAEKGVWSKLAADYPEAISKKTFKDGQVQYSVDMDKYREGGTGPGGEQNVGSAKAGTKMAKGEPLTPEKLQERLPDLAQKHLTPEEKASITTTATGKPRSAGTEKFVKNMVDIPTVQEYVDIAKQGEGARKWYSRSTAAFDAMHDEAPEYFKNGDKEKFMGVLAGSSPQQSVAMNLRETLGFWKEWNDAGRPKFDLDKWKEFGDAARKGWEEDGSPRSRGMANGASMHWDYAPTGPKWKAENLLLKNLALPETKVPNIIKALNGEPMWPDLTKNQAFKAPSFAENLKKWIDGKSAGTKHVTNDSWMGLFGGIDKSALSKPENYHPLSVATRAAAEALGWEPEEAQAAIWSFTQALTEKGVEDPEIVRHYSEDFKDLLANDLETRDILKGLGVNLDQLDRKLDAIGEKPKVSGRSTPTTAHSVGQLRGRIEDARGKGAIPEPKSVQGNLFRENPAFEHKAKPGEGHFTQPRDEATRFDPDEFKNEDAGLTKLGEKKKKSPYGNVR